MIQLKDVGLDYPSQHWVETHHYSKLKMHLDL